MGPSERHERSAWRFVPCLSAHSSWFTFWDAPEQLSSVLQYSGRMLWFLPWTSRKASGRSTRTKGNPSVYLLGKNSATPPKAWEYLRVPPADRVTLTVINCLLSTAQNLVNFFPRALRRETLESVQQFPSFTHTYRRPTMCPVQWRFPSLSSTDPEMHWLFKGVPRSGSKGF